MIDVSLSATTVYYGSLPMSSTCRVVWEGAQPFGRLRTFGRVNEKAVSWGCGVSLITMVRAGSGPSAEEQNSPPALPDGFQQRDGTRLGNELCLANLSYVCREEAFALRFVADEPELRSARKFGNSPS